MNTVTILTPVVPAIHFSQDQIDQFQARYNYLTELHEFGGERNLDDEEYYEMKTLKALLSWIADSHDLG